MPLYSHPFSADYWREALQSFRSVRTMIFSAVMIAACIALSHFQIPLTESLSRMSHFWPGRYARWSADPLRFWCLPLRRTP